MSPVTLIVLNGGSRTVKKLQTFFLWRKVNVVICNFGSTNLFCLLCFLTITGLWLSDFPVFILYFILFLIYLPNSAMSVLPLENLGGCCYVYLPYRIIFSVRIIWLSIPSIDLNISRFTESQIFMGTKETTVTYLLSSFYGMPYWILVRLVHTGVRNSSLHELYRLSISLANGWTFIDILCHGFA